MNGHVASSPRAAAFRRRRVHRDRAQLQHEPRLAQPQTGKASQEFRAFIDGEVRSISFANGRLYIGGAFLKVDGLKIDRLRLGRRDDRRRQPGLSPRSGRRRRGGRHGRRQGLRRRLFLKSGRRFPVFGLAALDAVHGPLGPVMALSCRPRRADRGVSTRWPSTTVACTRAASSPRPMPLAAATSSPPSTSAQAHSALSAPTPTARCRRSPSAGEFRRPGRRLRPRPRPVGAGSSPGGRALGGAGGGLQPRHAEYRGRSRTRRAADVRRAALGRRFRPRARSSSGARASGGASPRSTRTSSRSIRSTANQASFKSKVRATCFAGRWRPRLYAGGYISRISGFKIRFVKHNVKRTR